MRRNKFLRPVLAGAVFVLLSMQACSPDAGPNDNATAQPRAAKKPAERAPTTVVKGPAVSAKSLAQMFAAVCLPHRPNIQKALDAAALQKRLRYDSQRTGCREGNGLRGASWQWDETDFRFDLNVYGHPSRLSYSTYGCSLIGSTQTEYEEIAATVATHLRVDFEHPDSDRTDTFGYRSRKWVIERTQDGDATLEMSYNANRYLHARISQKIASFDICEISLPKH